MATNLQTPESPPQVPVTWTAADLQAQLGGIPPERIHLRPAPGTATKKDVAELDDHYDRLCELIDGTLVEKTMGYVESRLAMFLGHLLHTFLDTHDLGFLLGEAGTLEILPDQVRIPDVCFISWEKFPDRKLPTEPIPALAPDLAVEVLSASNTDAEMQRKLCEYFAAGVRLVWYIVPASRSARAYTAVDAFVDLGENDSLSGGDVLPGFTLSLGELFAKVLG